MAPTTICFCGATFGTRLAFRDHVNKHGHQYQCECKTLVATEKALNDHLDDTKHSSSETSFSAKDLHIKAPDLDSCAICGYKHSDAVQLQQHLSQQHHGCPTCAQVFTSTAQRLCHQRSVSHCYCTIHGLIFPDVESFSQHTRLDGHNQDFTCVECDRSFKTESAFEHHMNSDGHKEVVIEAINKSYQRLAAAKLAEANLYCEPCDRKFCNLEAFSKHKASVKHNPLSDLKCPLSSGCLGTFTSPSALLFHLESGSCKSGMTRSKLNAIIFKHDTNGRITVASQASHVLKAAASQASIDPHSPASQRVPSLQSASSSSFGGGRITPDLTSDTSTIRGGGSVIALEEDTDDTGSELEGFSNLTLNDTDSGGSGGAVLTPSASTISTNGGAPVSSSSSDSGVILTPSASSGRSDWSYVFSSMALTPASTSVDGSSVDTIRFDTEKKRWICPICSDAFRKKYDLIQHMNSPRHATKIFHCPTGLPGLSASSKPTLEFKTASGLAQHIEAGSCHGGKEMLGYITGLIEAQITEALGKTVKLLKE